MNPALPSTADELAACLCDHAAARTRVRLVGLDTRARFRTAPPPGAATVSTRGLRAIERLEPDDLTCSVEPGLPCRDLAIALHEKGLELDCVSPDDHGTVGGLYASDPLGTAVPGGSSPRSTLLGLDGILADGTRFRSGARVVKSVAGFDVHRLLVGSRGRLFAAALLHLKLRPVPRARLLFATAPSEWDAALRTYSALRREASGPARLLVAREPDGWRVRGRLHGLPRHVASLARAHGLVEVERAPADHLAPPPEGRELVVGTARPSVLPRLLEALPADAPFVAHAGGAFETVLRAAETDRLLAALPALQAHAAVAIGAPARVGTATALDAGAERLTRDLRLALDPGAVFA